MPIPKKFDPGKYLHRVNTSQHMADWFGAAALSRSDSLRDYFLNSPDFTTEGTINEKSNFHPEYNSGEIPYLFFTESQAFLNRSLSNFCAQLTLHKSGFLSWGIVTNYYSNFFAITGLNRLQGKARIATVDDSNLPRGFFASVSKISTPSCIIFPNWHNYHKQTAEDFYNSYRLFDLYPEWTEDLLSINVDGLKEEIKLRTDYNYNLKSGYRELDSPDYRRADLRIFNANKVNSLPSQITNPDFVLATIARTCCRIILLANLSRRFAKQKPILKIVFDDFLDKRKDLLDDVYGIESPLGSCLYRFTRGQMQLN